MGNTVQIIIRALDATKGGIGSALKGVGGMSNAISAMSKASLALGAVFAGSIAAITKHSIDAADELNDLSKKTGISVENLDRLQFAASQSGVSMESLTIAARSLNKQIAEAASGASGDAANAFAAMGLSVRDASGAIKSADQVMLEMADRFESYADGANKVAIAQKLLGKSGADMIPLLNEGGRSIQAMGDSIHPVTTEAARMSDEFNDTIGRIQRLFTDLGNDIAQAVLPDLNLMAKWFEEFISKSYDKSVNLVASSVRNLTEAMGAANAELGDAEDQFGKALAESFKKNIGDGLVSAMKAADLPPLPTKQDAPPVVNIKDAEKLKRMTDELFISQLHGSAKVMAEFKSAHDKRMEQVLEMQVTLEEGAAFEQKSLAEVEARKRDLYAEGIAQRMDLERAFEVGRMDQLDIFLKSESATQLASLENNRAMMDIRLEQWRAATESVSLMWARVGVSIQQGAFKGVSSSVEGLIKGTMSAAEAMKNLGKTILDSVVSAFSEMIAKLLIMKSLGFIFGGGGFLGKIFGFEKGGFTGFASGGFTGFGGASSVAGVVHKGEYVLPARTTAALGIEALDNLRAYGESGRLSGFDYQDSPQPMSVVFNLDGQVLARALGVMSRNGQLEISAGAIV